jgi:predicted nucleotide-binding protein
MDTLTELNEFYKKTIRYQKLLNDYSNIFFPSNSLQTRIKNLRSELQRYYAQFEKNIRKYGGSTKQIDLVLGTKTDIFKTAFGNIDNLNISENLDAINTAISILNIAIGKLKTEGNSWRALPEKTTNIKLHTASKKVKVFISHTGKTSARIKLCEYIKSLGFEILLVVEQPNINRTVDQKVNDYINDADIAIFLATGELTNKQGKKMPGENVIHEIGLAQRTNKLKKSIIYLLEDNTEFPSNIKPKVYISFNRKRIESIFTQINNEIKAIGY